MPKMRIFNRLEEIEFESIPKFNSIERKQFFTVSKAIEDLLEKLGTPTNKVCFLVTMGYFKARRRFFARQFRQVDIDFVAAKMGINPLEIHLETYSRETYARHQRFILEHLGYSSFNEVAKKFAVNEIQNLVRLQCRPKQILLNVIQSLVYRKFALPSYNVLATLIIEEIQKHEKTLSAAVFNLLTEKQREKLDSFLEKESDENHNSSYRLTFFKKTYQSTKPLKIKANLDDLKTLQPLYLEFQPVITQLNLSNASIRHYAYLVIKSQIPQISRRSAKIRYLYLIAFIAYQTFKLNDMLIDTLLQTVKNATNSADRNQKEAYFAERNQRNQSIDAFKQNAFETLSIIQQIIDDNKLNNNQKIDSISCAVKTEKAKLELLNVSEKRTQRGKDYFDALEEKSLKLQRRVSDIVRQIQFDKNSTKPLLLKALQHFQIHDGNIDKNAPMDFLAFQERTVLISEDGKFRTSLYKALLFVHVANAVKSGALNLIHSEKYRPLDDYLISKTDWQNNRSEYLERAKLTEFADCKTVLNSFKSALDKQYQQTNQNFKAGKNPYFSVLKDGKIDIKTPKQEESESLPLRTFFPAQKYISMIEVLATVNQATNFLDEFEHWQPKYQRKKPDAKTFFAGIIGYGCDIGHRKLAQISSEINENELENVVRWYFSLQNVHAANDRILQFVSQLDLPNIYLSKSEKLHTSSDGRKREVDDDSLNANYSFKYFGQNKGSSSITFIDPRNFMWYSVVISSAEREAAYVIDGLMHNNVVKSDIHSTDTHGYTEVIFASTCFLGFEFAPRIKKLSKQKLYAFESRKNYEEQEFVLLPSRRIRESLIENHWDDILRFIATIQLKITTASQLFRRLNSYSKQHSLYSALKEFGKIQKSLFILKYYDDCPFRQAIESQLNRVENSNKFSKAVSFGHSHELIQSEKEDQEIAESCQRLIKNAIVCWNYLYLSRELATEKNEERKAKLLDAIENGSVMTWAHFNLHGEFDFSDEKMQDSIGLVSPKNSPSKTA
jgi:TnpA family transposase